MASMHSTQLLRLPAVKDRTGLGRSTIYALVAAGRFPAPVPIAARAVAWDSRAIDKWIEECLVRKSPAK